MELPEEFKYLKAGNPSMYAFRYFWLGSFWITLFGVQVAASENKNYLIFKDEQLQHSLDQSGYGIC